MTERSEPARYKEIGELLQAQLQELELGTSQFARLVAMSVTTVSAILHGRHGVGPRTALRLEVVTGVPAIRWMTIQAQADLDRELVDQAEFLREMDRRMDEYLRG